MAWKNKEQQQAWRLKNGRASDKKYYNKNKEKIAEYKNIALVVGSEGSGIRNLVKKNCDLLVRIDTNKEVESLNVSVATAIALNEIYRNKNV